MTAVVPVASSVLNAASSSEKYPSFTDKYDVERIIGRGGMGTVFEARHTRLGHRVAIKILGDELRVHPELVRRFEREARAAGALTSPHAVRVFDIDQTDDGTPFMVMELLRGRDLSHLIEQDGAQSVGMSVRWIIEACDAIAEAHRLGIVHRDIKPSNLLLCDTGSIKVLDFGIAKRVAAKEAAITQGVAPLGTPQYMSPEQVRCAKDVDGRSDIWSLGITLYELVTGRPPFNHEVAQACVAAIVADPIPDPREFNAGLPSELVDVVMKALAKDVTERFQTVDEFVLALEPLADKTDSGSWRVITGARRMVAKEQATLDGDDVVDVVELIADEAGTAAGTDDSDSEPVLALQPGRMHHRRMPSFDTVPPLVGVGTRQSLAASRGKRIRSTLALASAAVLGLAALVATPKCVGSRIDSANATAAKSAAAALSTAAAAAAMTDMPSSAVTAPQQPTPTPTIVVPPSEEPLMTATQKTAPKASSSAKTAPSPRSPSAPVKVIGGDRPVHGGISNPGF